MQQSTRRRSSSVTPRLGAAAAAFALACALPGAVSAEEGDGAAVDAAAADAGGGILRPRWIEPQRADDASAVTEARAAESEPAESGSTESAAARDWRSGSRIILHAVGDNTSFAARVEDTLVDLGAEAIERRVVEASAATDQVRYFHPEDASMAADLADVLETRVGDVRVRDLTFYRPSPESGSLEIWLR